MNDLTRRLRLQGMAIGAGTEFYAPVVVLRPEVVAVGDQSRVDSFVKLEGGLGLTIGRQTHVASFAHLGVGGGRLVVGDAVGICSGAKVLSGTALPEGRSMSAAAPALWQSIVRGVTTIGDYACICTNAVVLPGVTIGTGAIVAAGAVVTGDVPPWEVWAGVPARRVRQRERAEVPA